MSPEGTLLVQLGVVDERVADVTVRSTRRTDVASLLVGLPPEQALRVVPSLFALCGHAHAVASLEACEAALALDGSDASRARRELLVLLEALESHAFACCVDWQAAVGAPPLVAPLKALRDATAGLRAWATAGTDWLRVGGDPRRLPPADRALLLALEAAVESVSPDQALASPDDARRFTQSDAAPALLRAVAGLPSAPRGPAPLLPTLDAAWFAQALATPGFSQRPTWRGVPAEAGALAYAQQHPTVAALLEAEGPTVRVRLVARLADLRARARRVAALTQGDSLPGSSDCRTGGAGQGTGVADTARGRLAHQVEVRDGRVTAWRSVAPTEWTFHPQGVLRASLLDTPARALAERAGWLVTALDPCVPCSLEVQTAHAVAGA